MASLKILIEEGKLMPHDVQFLLKAGAGANDERAKQFSWMDVKTWSNLKALSSHRFSKNNSVTFKDLPDRISRNEPAWQNWIEENEPENSPILDLADKIASDSISHFIETVSHPMCQRRPNFACFDKVYIWSVGNTVHSASNRLSWRVVEGKCYQHSSSFLAVCWSRPHQLNRWVC